MTNKGPIMDRYSSEVQGDQVFFYTDSDGEWARYEDAVQEIEDIRLAAYELGRQAGMAEAAAEQERLEAKRRELSASLRRPIASAKDAPRMTVSFYDQEGAKVLGFSTRFGDASVRAPAADALREYLPWVISMLGKKDGGW
jgi:hypothetical protein